MSINSECAMIDCEEFDGIQMPASFKEVRDTISAFNVRDDDICNPDVVIPLIQKAVRITWCQEMVWLLGNNLDYEGAKNHLEIRFPFLECNTIADECVKFIKEHNIKSGFSDRIVPNSIELLESSNNKRFVKTHLPWNFLPKQIVQGSKTPKIIHVMRNPKQVVPSYYHHALIVFPIFKGSLDQFVDAYVEGNVLYGNYFTTALSYWNQRHLPNLLIITYEEMHSNLRKVIEKVAAFLGKSYSDDQIKKLAHHLSFDQMKNNRAVNKADFVKNDDLKFMRKGETDSYKSELTPEIVQKLDKWIEECTKAYRCIGETDSYKSELTPEMVQKLDKWIEECTKGTEFPYRTT